MTGLIETETAHRGLAMMRWTANSSYNTWRATLPRVPISCAGRSSRITLNRCWTVEADAQVSALHSSIIESCQTDALGKN